MTMLTMAMHPSDETLSRLADLSEAERMRSRAGRHVARCARCGAELAAIAALGDIARGMADIEVPRTLSSRVNETRRREAMPPSTTSVLADVIESAGSPRIERPRHWITKKRGAVLAAAAAIGLGVLVRPEWQQRGLAATSHGIATIYPRYPRPGATIGIRFVPAAKWAGGDTLWAEASVDLRDSPRSGGSRTGMAYLPILLVRDRDGAYRGRATLPAAALSGDILVMTAPPGSMTGRQVTDILLLTSDSLPARPSLDAMERAAFHVRGFMTNHLLAEEFARWAPDHPMRWFLADSRAGTGTFDWLKFFDSAERRFGRLTTRLNAKANARPGELAGMAWLAYRIEEPGAAAQWTDRLMREHPDDPWALDLRVMELHEMELRRVPRDSIARLIPSLDTLYERSGRRPGYAYDLWNVIANNADSATIHRWSVREARSGRFFGTEFNGRAAAFRDPEVRDSAEAYAREVLAGNTAIDLRMGWLERPRAYLTLASVALARGDYARALRLTDSTRTLAASIRAAPGRCLAIGGDTRALALLALGDTAGATPYLAAFGVNSVILSPDSAERMLGSYFTPERWQHAVDSVEAARRACRLQAK